jgi:hypothetical protein
MAFSANGVQQTPDILNETYKNNGVYTNDLINFWSIPNCFPQIKAEEYEDYYDSPAPLDKFYKWLDMGLPVIVLVDFDLNPSNSVQTHFVLLNGYDDVTRDLMCIDPWTGEEYFFKAKYGDPATFIYGHRFYSWEVVNEPTCERKLAEKTQEAIKFSEMLDEKTVLVGQLEKELEKETIAKDAALGQEAEIRKELAEVYGDKKGLESQVETIKKEVAELGSRLVDKDKELSAVSEALKDAGTQFLSGLSTRQIVSELFRRFLGRKK